MTLPSAEIANIAVADSLFSGVLGRYSLFHLGMTS